MSQQDKCVVATQVLVNVADLVALASLVGDLDGFSAIEDRNKNASQAHEIIERSLGKHAELAYINEDQKAPLANTKARSQREVYINDTKFKRTIRTLKVFFTTRHSWDMSWYLARK